jgi:hypothetical protein
VGIRHADHVAPSIRKSWQSLRRQAAVARSVWFALGLRPWSLVLVLFCRCNANREYENSYLSEISSALFRIFRQIDDCRRTHNYDEFICTFLSMLAQQGKLADLVQQHLVQHKKPGLPLPRVQRCVFCIVLLNRLVKMIMLPTCIW